MISSFSKTILILKTSIRFIAYYWSVVRVEIIFSICLKIIHALIPSIQLIITKKMVDSISEIFQHRENLDYAMQYLAIQTLLLIIGHVLISLERINNIKMQNKITFVTEERIITKTSSIPIMHYEKSDFYDQLLRVSSGQSQRVVEMFNGPLIVLQNILTLSTLIGIISTIHWLTSISIILFAFLPLVINIKISKLNHNLNRETTQLSRLINYFLNLLKGRESAKEIRVFQLQDYLINRWKIVYQKYTNRKFSFDIYNSYFRTGLEVLTAVLIALNLGFIIWIGAKSNLTIGDYTAISQAFISIQGILVTLSYSISSLYANSLSIQELIQFLEFSDELAVDNNTNIKTDENDLIGNGIFVDNLNFYYDKNGPPILDHISFRIHPGEKVAIVGDNGAGKSTLVKCLLGFYRTYNGNIYYGETELRNIPSSKIFNHVSTVFQDFCKYELTVNENIAFGDVRHIDDKNKIIDASIKGDSFSFINQFPIKYDTQLGRSFNGGTELSGGQWQKMAISRAFFRSSKIIILDEPAASLDPFAEASLYKKFTELSNGKTTIIISHRLSSCINADLILVMKQGKIVEQGSHKELLSLDGYYAKMFNLQAKNYHSADTVC
ncbi:ATP-binding cassette, subfamily B [Fontibacillus panacisegetis]|uniref:ATP-binding cassette, subfamily B n=1 Tax=Fontibacillus panacisegetis TaxID=670482 RepID=A0A1G7VGQ8_9BACL|nr:ABC transporter ATP-binding protein [Fontibacillus panacisegetis]SDG58877.1 ATP-binding cassette, subfamily B [Fontibacillus panacisegetis]